MDDSGSGQREEIKFSIANTVPRRQWLRDGQSIAAAATGANAGSAGAGPLGLSGTNNPMSAGGSAGGGSGGAGGGANASSLDRAIRLSHAFTLCGLKIDFLTNDVMV